MKTIKKVFKSILLLIFIYLTTIPLLPLYYKLFVPFPKLEEATVYHGILSVEGKISLSKIKCNTSIKYYVTDSSGKHEIYYGLPGCREYRGKYPSKKSAIGTFWFHPEFGVIQADYRFNFEDPEFEETGKERNFASYETINERFKNQFDYRNTFIRSIPFILLLIYLIRSANKLIRSLYSKK